MCYPSAFLSAVLATICQTPVARGVELADIVAKVEPSVVRIDTDEGIGSGVVIGKGLVLTNFHVVEDAEEITVQVRSGKEFPSQGFIVAQPTYDLCVIRVTDLDQSPVIELAGAMPRVGDRVAAFGTPAGLSFTTSEGIVSAIRTGKEFEELLGAANYQRLGHSPHLTWLQSTAEMTGGSSGGPLVNMDGRLVGICTWGNDSGQQLNFALSVKNIREVLGQLKPDMKPKPFASLPKNPLVPVTPADPTDPSNSDPSNSDPPQNPDEFALKLPTGRVFTFEVFRTDREAVQHLAKQSQTVVLRHPNGSMYATAQHLGGVLDGMTRAQYDNKAPMLEAVYSNGRRHGNLIMLTEGGEPLFLGQYNQGRKHGFVCHFDKDKLVLIAQYKQDQLEYLQLMSDLKRLQGFASEAEALKNPDAKVRLEALEAFDRDLKKNEAAFRRQVKQIEDDKRRDIAAKLGPEKRARISERDRSRRAAEDAFIQQMRRRTHGF